MQTNSVVLLIKADMFTFGVADGDMDGISVEIANEEALLTPDEATPPPTIEASAMITKT